EGRELVERPLRGFFGDHRVDLDALDARQEVVDALDGLGALGRTRAGACGEEHESGEETGSCGDGRTHHLQLHWETRADRLVRRPCRIPPCSAAGIAGLEPQPDPSRRSATSAAPTPARATRPRL